MNRNSRRGMYFDDYSIGVSECNNQNPGISKPAEALDQPFLSQINVKQIWNFQFLKRQKEPSNYDFPGCSSKANLKPWY